MEWMMACFFSSPIFLSYPFSLPLSLLSTLFFFSLHPSCNWLSSLPSLIMNCVCFLSHFPPYPLVWSPLLILHLTPSPSLCFISWMALAWTLSSLYLFILALRVIRSSSVSYHLLFFPLSPLPLYLFFFSSSLDNFVRLVVMLLSF